MYQIYFIYMYNTLKKFKDYNFYIEIKNYSILLFKNYLIQLHSHLVIN